MEHLNFSKIKIDYTERRKRTFPGYDIKPKSFIKHGNYIQKSIEKNIEDIKDKSKSMKFNPYLVMKIELEDGVKFNEKEQDDLEVYGLKIIDNENNQLQVVFSNDLDLKIFNEELSKYSSGVIARKNVIHKDLFEKIKSVQSWGYDDRKAFKNKEKKQNNYLDVYLWVFDTIEESTSKMEEFKKFVESQEGYVTDRYIGKSVVIARVKVNSTVLEKILYNPLVYKVEDIQKITFLSKQIQAINNIEIEDIDYDNKNMDPDSSQSICVIDSGVYAQHPLLKGVIGDSRAFFIKDEFDNIDDINGHGTCVASICEYGDFKYNQKFRPTIYIHSAKIHNGEYDSPEELLRFEIDSKIERLTGDKLDDYLRLCDEDITFEDFLNDFEDDVKPFIMMTYSKYQTMYDKLIPNQMKEIVDYFKDTYNCRIYNLSQGILDNVYMGEKPKAWCCVLDELQNRKDVLFIVSSGNYVLDSKNIEDTINDYPQKFFIENDYKIIEPANSVNSVTVGSLAISSNMFQDPNLNSVRLHSVTKKNQLSVLTRVGPGVNNSIKPEFVAYGGDYGINENILGKKHPVIKNKGISKLLFNNNRKDIFTWYSGTSFAAPYVAHIAAKILERYKDISNNMIRALLANSAYHPDEVISLVDKCKGLNTIFNKEFIHNYKGKDINNFNKMLYYTAGYGFPNINKCLNSEDNNVVLMADMVKEDEWIQVDGIDVFEIPLPYEFRRSKGVKTVSVTLAYNPKVRNTRIDYIGTQLEFRIVKGKSLNEVIEMFKKQKKGDEIVIEGECKLSNPGIALRSKGTLQKDIYEFRQDRNFNNNNLFVVVSCKKNWDISPQKYALVVSLQTKDNIPLYNIIRRRLALKTRRRV